MRYNLFIGRFQSPHNGHLEIFNTYLKENKPVLIAIRETIQSVDNPLTAKQVKQLFETIYKGNELVKIIIIPDIDSVNYGRGVGYEVNEIKVNESISNISATEIRNQILNNQIDWKKQVHKSIHSLLKKYIKKSKQ